MAKNKAIPASSSSPTVASLSEIAKATSATPPLLPGESETEYLSGRRGAIEELGAQTHLQVYLAEKIFDCLWWMHSYENQKRATLIRAMVDQILPVVGTSTTRLVITCAITDRQWEDEELVKLMKQKGLTPDSLLQQAMTFRPDYQIRLDELIALRAKTLTSLQSSYEALVNRSILRERLRLQNELLKRDLTAIDVESVNVGDGVGPESGKPKKARR
jgi:hypothetical protein